MAEGAKGRRKLDRRETLVEGALPGGGDQPLRWTPSEESRPSLGELVDLICGDPDLLANAVIRDLEAAPARFQDPRSPMHPRLKTKLLERGLSQLFTHQAQAYDLASAGKDVVAVTGTSSGKTLCYTLPILQASLTEPLLTALALYPTKALAHDQLLKLESLLPGPDIRAGVYDGDTARATRAIVRQNAHIILTNPDMLHLGILPHHETWTKFLKTLRFIVIDEMHVYRGIFGSHVGCVLRRLLRLCEWHGSRPQVIACSATIDNPTDLFTRLTGRAPVVVDDDGAPRGRRTLVLLGSRAEQEVADDDLGDAGVAPAKRAGANDLAARMLTRLVRMRARALVFCTGRTATELVLKRTRSLLRAEKLPAASVESYRGGYTPKERREIEKGLFSGTLRGLVTTSAMELGVDIGNLDCTILNGYPGSLASFWQQVGRAGRGGRDALAVFLAHEDPLEQFLVRRPDLLLAAGMEAATLNPSNPSILGPHLRCAAFERPIAPSELMAFGSDAATIAEGLEAAGELVFSAGRFYYPSHQDPSSSVAIRGFPGKSYELMVGSEAIGLMEAWRSQAEGHPGAVYLHRDKSYLVEALDAGARQIRLVESDVDYYTQPLIAASVAVRGHLGEPQLMASLCSVEASLTVTGFRKVSLADHELLETSALELPSASFGTVAVRIDLPNRMVDADPEAAILAIHGLEHALLAVAPLVAGCDRSDIASAWYVTFPETLSPCLFVFDRAPGGVGIAERLFVDLGRWLQKAYDLLDSCPCEEGCPLCLMLPRCEYANQSLDKAGALTILAAMLAALSHSDED